MGNSLNFLPSRDEVRARYSVRLLAGAQATERGVVHQEGAAERLLEWGEVDWVLAAEVGEPQGVRTVVFDLVVDGGAGSFAVCRFDAEPGEDAVAVARAIAGALPAERLGAYGVDSDDLIEGEADPQAVSLVVDEVLTMADDYYRSADEGMRFLPARARWAILVASRLYQGIGRRL
mgnify:CR=1 FL=1